MNSKNPLQIVFFGSFLTALVTLCVLFLLDLYVASIGWFVIGVVTSLVFAITFTVFYFLFIRLIDSRISVILRTIRKEKFKETPQNRKLNSNLIDEVSKETKQWAEERRSEISKLKAQEAFRKEFLGNLAHELKTPIFSIQGYILTLLEGGLEDPKVNREFLLRASKGVDRMTHIVEDLDDITRYESERFKLNIKKFDIVELAKDIINSLEFKSQNKDIQIRLEKEYDAIYVKADRDRISQVFTNLISNSISYGHESGQTKIRFHSIDEDLIMVEVADNGPGIAEEHMSRLFERFYRVDKSRARNSGGSGLGLAIAKHILESHGQDIDVRSSEGVGSTFSFTLEKAQ